MVEVAKSQQHTETHTHTEELLMRSLNDFQLRRLIEPRWLLELRTAPSEAVLRHDLWLLPDFHMC
eukprot:1800261-Amphidinium_carterae.1